MNLLDTLGWRTTGALNRLSDRLWSQRLGIETSGTKDVHAPDANRYATFAFRSINLILDRLQLKPNDVFLDIGCGKGRVICCAAMRELQRVIGIDIDDQLCDIARSNANRLRNRRTPIEVICTGAQEFDYGDCTAMFLFNSFGAATVGAMLEAIDQSLRDKPRAIRMAYVNPFHDQLFEQHGSWERDGRLRRAPWSGLKFDVSFWRRP
jgi:cyclopropane fatty-acyl-phospholipid synthase-like methyltransferase